MLYEVGAPNVPASAVPCPLDQVTLRALSPGFAAFATGAGGVDKSSWTVAVATGVVFVPAGKAQMKSDESELWQEICARAIRSAAVLTPLKMVALMLLANDAVCAL